MSGAGPDWGIFQINNRRRTLRSRPEDIDRFEVVIDWRQGEFRIFDDRDPSRTRRELAAGSISDRQDMGELLSAFQELLERFARDPAFNEHMREMFQQHGRNIDLERLASFISPSVIT